MRILLVEDEIEIHKFLKHSLEAACYAVDIAEDGEQGVFLAKTNNYDLIILDMMLPKKNGDQVCQEIRAAGIITPIIILSVRSETNTKINLLNLGADDYLTKPFSFEELIARIKAILRRPQKLENVDTILIDNLNIDPDNYTVERGGKNVYLTRKEFMLLKYLLQNIGKVLTRSQIMEHVWDINADPFSNTIETHIRNLRKKVDSKGEKKLIHTIPGRGYKLDLEK